jgi:hypothetical protein
MIVKKTFQIRKWVSPKISGLSGKEQVINCEGWYLFGFIPLYIKEYYCR